MESSHPEHRKNKEKTTYEAPAIIYETVITTRAGSPLSTDDSNPGVDPADLFGSGN